MSAPQTNEVSRSDAGVDDVRLTFGVATVRGSTIDATWWPRSTRLVHDLPPLIVALRQHGVRVSRVSYNPSLWEPTPNRIYADGRTVRLGWFASIDPTLLVLTGTDSNRSFTVLVVPPPAQDEAPSAAA
jgi:hypothetical protein